MHQHLLLALTFVLVNALLEQPGGALVLVAHLGKHLLHQGHVRLSAQPLAQTCAAISTGGCRKSALGQLIKRIQIMRRGRSHRCWSQKNIIDSLLM